MTVDRYSVGASFDDIPKPDLDAIMKYALWSRRKPDMLSISVALGLLVIAALMSTVIVMNREKSQLERRIRITREDMSTLEELSKIIAKEKEEMARRVASLSEEREILLARLRTSEEAARAGPAPPAETAASGKAETTLLPLKESSAPETPAAEPAEAALDEDADLEPVVALREAEKSDAEDTVAPNVTRKMVEAEKGVYSSMRDYILSQEIQRLDRYCSTHASSIYHAAGLFALGELRYKNRSMKEMTIKAYRDVISLYPRSKYASYSSHRIEQVERNLPYESRDLRYYTTHYNLPPLYDYRELEPYKQ
jgi:hypothetical protein